MAPSEEWTRSCKLSDLEIAAVCEQTGLWCRGINDLTSTGENYPEVIPVLVDWVRHTQVKSVITDPLERMQFRIGFYMALRTEEAAVPEVMDLLFERLYSDPWAPKHFLSDIAITLGMFLAGPVDFDRMVAAGVDRSLGEGRGPIVEWVLGCQDIRGLELMVGQVDDPSVRASVLRGLRSFRKLPSGLRPVVQRYVDDTSSEVRKQAKRTLAKLPE
ncbi:MAG: HEAT repeat domain-containing protein [Mycobacteriaceae bacterium]